VRPEVPAHVPSDLVRDFDVDYHGPLAAMFPSFDALRDEGRVLWLRPITGTTQPGPYGEVPGVWIFTRGDDIRDALQRPEVFSSHFTDEGMPAMIPVFLDPPDHTRYRRLLNPLFTPAVVHAMEESIRARMIGLIDAVRERGGCDFVAEIAVQFPTKVFTSWIGLPEDQTGSFVAMVKQLIHTSDDASSRQTALAEALVAVDQLIRDRRAQPTDDLMSQIMDQALDDRPLDHDELVNIAFLLFLAGLDTVVAALSFSFWHLARTPDDRDAIARGDVSANDAVEELLRRHSFLNVPRLLTRDTELGGVTLKEGDAVILPTALASRDPEEFDNPADVQLDRHGYRHYAFGLGPHRCIGSHLARLEMRIAFEEWHRRIPEYELAGDVESYGGIVMGVTALPLRWTGS
jgi:cytochrome P450